MKHNRTKRKPNKKNIFKIIFSVSLVFILTIIVFSLGNINKKEPIKKVETKEVWTLNTVNNFSTNNGNKIFIEVADTDEAKAQGLSGKNKLNFYENNGKITTEGMLFVFEREMVENFWMKDMNFDLDMIWLDKNYNIVYMYKNALASSYNSENPQNSYIFTNGQNSLAKYVLEINSGMADKMNIHIGDRLQINDK